MAEKSGSAVKLHIAFLPYPAPGHTIPMLDMVLLMASRQVKTTVITTPLNALNVAKHLNIDQPNEHEFGNGCVAPSIHVVPFPSSEKTGLPEGLQNLGLVNSCQGFHKFNISMNMLKDPVEQFIEKNKPDCLVADFFFPFATNLAKKFGIPRLAFNVTGFFPICVMMGLRQCQPCTTVLSEYEPFLVPGLPHEIIMSKSQLIEEDDGDTDFQECMDVATKGYMASYGQVYNTFYELEPDYADRCKSSHERVWTIGPVSLCTRGIGGHFKRGEGATISHEECLKWLDSKAPNSVIYLSFGTLTHFKDSQLMEIAIALENFGRDFIWVVRERKGEDMAQCEEAWLPDGYEKRIEGRGLIIKGWAPQVLILEHKAIEVFVTHCGWNSALEGFAAGVPMVTWPLHAEHFYIEKLITEVLKIGVQVGNKKWSSTGEGTFIDHQMLEGALKQVIEGKDSLEMRRKAKKLKEMAYKAVQEGGSSYCQLDSLIDDLASYSSRNTEMDS